MRYNYTVMILLSFLMFLETMNFIFMDLTKSPSLCLLTGWVWRFINWYGVVGYQL